MEADKSRIVIYAEDETTGEGIPGVEFEIVDLTTGDIYVPSTITDDKGYAIELVDPNVHYVHILDAGPSHVMPTTKAYRCVSIAGKTEWFKFTLSQKT